MYIYTQKIIKQNIVTKKERRVGVRHKRNKPEIERLEIRERKRERERKCLSEAVRLVRCSAVGDWRERRWQCGGYGLRAETGGMKSWLFAYFTVFPLLSAYFLYFLEAPHWSHE